MEQPLLREFNDKIGDRLKKGKSWISWAEDVIRQVCKLSSISPGAEWAPLTSGFKDIFIIITLNKSCREQNPDVVIVDVSPLISKNSSDTNAVIYLGGSLVHHQHLGIHCMRW